MMITWTGCTISTTIKLSWRWVFIPKKSMKNRKRQLEIHNPHSHQMKTFQNPSVIKPLFSLSLTDISYNLSIQYEKWSPMQIRIFSCNTMIRWFYFIYSLWKGLRITNKVLFLRSYKKAIVKQKTKLRKRFWIEFVSVY